MSKAYLLLGSNIDPEEHLRRAVKLLAQRVQVMGVSKTFESPPVGYSEQPCFLNAAVAIETPLAPHRLLREVLRPLEAELGRVRTGNKYGPRTIDIDILLYDDRVLVCGGRRIPDPDLLRRAHVAVPVADLAPEIIHPEAGETLRTIAARMDSHAIHQRPDIQLALILDQSEEGR